MHKRGMMLIATLLFGCRDSTAPGVVDGTYTLQTVRGGPLPAMVLEGTDYAFKITGGTITLHADRTFSDAYSYSQYDRGTVETWTMVCTGVWRQRSDRKYWLEETRDPGCAKDGDASWGGRTRLTITWSVIGTAVHER